MYICNACAIYTRARADVRVFSARACVSFVAALSGFTTECNGDSLPWSAVVLCWSHRIETDCAAVATFDSDRPPALRCAGRPTEPFWVHHPEPHGVGFKPAKATAQARSPSKNLDNRTTESLRTSSVRLSRRPTSAIRTRRGLVHVPVWHCDMVKPGPYITQGRRGACNI